MIYNAQLISREFGNIVNVFGEIEAMSEVAARNVVRFECKVAPANTAEIEEKIAELQSEYQALDLSYQNSPWGEGPRYRTKMETTRCEIDRHIGYLREVAA